MRHITITAKPNSKKEGLEILPDGSFLIRTRAIAAEGKANQRIIEMLAEHLGIAKSKIEIVSGHKGRRKVVRVTD